MPSKSYVYENKEMQMHDEEMLSFCSEYAKVHGVFPRMTNYRCADFYYFKECVRTAVSSGLPLENYLQRSFVFGSEPLHRSGKK